MLSLVPRLTKMTQGIRKGEMLLLTAGTGIGKSTMAREIAYKLKMQDGLKVGLVMLERIRINLKRPYVYQCRENLCI